MKAAKKFLQNNPYRTLLKSLFEKHGILPWDDRIREMHDYDVEIMNMVMNDGNTVESSEDTPTDPLLAAYRLPKIPGFEEQEKKLKKLKEEGLLNIKQPIPQEGITFDPSRGIGLPNASTLGGGYIGRST